jgi:signal peptidase II
VFWIIIIVVALLDQISKFFVQSSCVLNETIPFISGVFDITYIHNYGAAFSILQNKQTFLIIFTSIAMFAIIIYFIREKSVLLSTEIIALAFIVGGGIGNLINRIFYGYVVDFLNIYIIPVFNVADMSVCIGSALLVYSVLILEPKHNKDMQASEDGK